MSGCTYRDPCPKCGARLVGFTKEDYVSHLRENGETLAARIEEEMVVEESATSQTVGSGSNQNGCTSGGQPRMRVHKTRDADPIPPVLYRHAKCKNCDHRFRYHISAAEDNRGKRPPCPECGKQGTGGPFGRTNPAEWLAIVQAAAEGTPFTYADWLAGDAALYKWLDKSDDPQQERYVTVTPRKDYLPCRITEHLNGEGVWGTGFSPHVWMKWLHHGANMELVDVAEAPERSSFASEGESHE